MAFLFGFPWTVLYELEENDLYTRLTSYWQSLTNCAGFYVGCSYFVIVTDPATFLDAGWMSPYVRSNLVGACLLLAFIFSLFSMIVSSALYGRLILLGPQHTRHFVESMKWYGQMPTQSIMMATFAMLLGAQLSIGGLYDGYVAAVCIPLSILIFLFAYYVFVKSNVEFAKHTLHSNVPCFHDSQCMV